MRGGLVQFSLRRRASVCLKQNLMAAGGLQTQIKNRVGLFLPALLNYGGPSFPPELGPFDF
jgi:hypothetical protein